MGADLALYLCSMFPINGCIVGGTVLKFNNPFTIHFLNPLLCRILKLSKKEIKNDTTRKYYGYTSYPLIALNEMRKLTNMITKKLPEVTVPVLIIHSKADKLSLEKNVDLVYNQIQSTIKEKFFVDNAHHNLFDENEDQEKIFKQILNFITKH